MYRILIVEDDAGIARGGAGIVLRLSYNRSFAFPGRN